MSSSGDTCQKCCGLLRIRIERVQARTFVGTVRTSTLGGVTRTAPTFAKPKVCRTAGTAWFCDVIVIKELKMVFGETEREFQLGNKSR